jgi:hypothetical protein
MDLPRHGGIDLRHACPRDWRTVFTSCPDVRDANCPAGEVVAGHAALAVSLLSRRRSRYRVRSCGAGEPAAVQVGEAATVGLQLLGRARLDHPAVLDHRDLVGLDHG